jgi:threonine 3-dehydrogenase
MEGKTLITGACGQIGTELTGALIERYGNTSVVASDIRRAASFDCEFVELDITDAAALSHTVRDLGVTRIIHLAAILSARAELDPELAYSVNVGGTKNILDAAVRWNVQQVFLPSTIAVFGPETPKDMVPVDTVTRPVSIYGISKLFGELLGLYFHRRYELDVRGLRLPGIVSWRAPPGGGTTDYAVEMIEHAVKNKNYTCFLRRNTVLPMMYMADAIDAILRLLDAPSSNLRYRTSYNVSSFSFSPADLEQELRKLFPDFSVSYEPDARQTIAEGWPRTLDISAAVSDWGFRSSYTFSSMVEDMVKHVSKKREYKVTGNSNR